MSDRIFAILMFVLSGLLVIGALSWEVPFAYDPLGPKAFPLLLAGLLVGLSIWLLVKPGKETDMPRGAVLINKFVVILTLLAYVFLFEWLGFILSTLLMTAVIGRLFGASWLQCLAGGVGYSLGFFVLFRWLLDIPLPIGRVLGA